MSKQIRYLAGLCRRRLWEYQQSFVNIPRFCGFHKNHLVDTEQVKFHSQQMRKQGYTIIEDAFSSTELDKLEDYFQKMINDVDYLDYPFSDLKKRKSIDDKENDIPIRKGDYDSVAQILQETEIRKLQVKLLKSKVNWEIMNLLPFNPTLLSIIARYMGIVPLLFQFSMVRSLPTRLGFDSNSYHRDQEDPRYMVKIFLYLNDVDLENGPHAYIAESANRFYPDQNKKTRFTDDEIYSFFGRHREQIFTGKRGTIIVEDTRGYHKGCRLLKNHRDIYMCSYIGYKRNYNIRHNAQLDARVLSPLQRKVAHYLLKNKTL